MAGLMLLAGLSRVAQAQQSPSEGPDVQEQIPSGAAAEESAVDGPPRSARPPAPDAEAGGTDTGVELPPRTLAPSVLALRLPRDEAGVVFGVSRLSANAASLTTVTGGLYVESMSDDERFGIRLQLPVASADAALVGDLDLDLGWMVFTRGDSSESSFVTVALGFTVPINLLNTLGGNGTEIQARRFRRYPTVTALNLLPIRYFQMTPHIGAFQRFGPVLMYGEIGGTLVLGCRYANYYESPNVEAALQYGVGLAGQLIETADASTSLALGLELSGTHFFTTVAPVMVTEVRPQPASALSLAPSVRARIGDRVVVQAGVAMALAGRQTWTRYTPSTLWQHDVTVFLQAGLPY